MKTFSSTVFREFERELSFPLFFGVPIGSTLNDVLALRCLSGCHTWSYKNRILKHLLIARHRLIPKTNKTSFKSLPKRKILVSWLDATPHLSELVRPILEEFETKDCIVLCGKENVVSLVPNDVTYILWDHVISYNVNNWRIEYRRCKSKWAFRIKSLCLKYELPRGASDELELSMMIASQQVMSCIEFLKQINPAVILTEYDRNAKLSCLVLAAKLLHIPTVTLVHGVMGEDALFFSPVLADKIVCWGKLGRDKLLADGEPKDKIYIGGCTRLSRELPTFVSNRIQNISLEPQSPIIMLGSAGEPQKLILTELFCIAVMKLENFTGMVRLRPSEKLISYEGLIASYPSILFFESNPVPLDESLALADIIVCTSSGIGTDALVKGLNVVVLGVDEEPFGHGVDLVKFAGCPYARTADELAEIIKKIISDEKFRNQLAITRETYVEDYCSAYGSDSARITADIIRQQIA